MNTSDLQVVAIIQEDRVIFTITANNSRELIIIVDNSVYFPNITS